MNERPSIDTTQAGRGLPDEHDQRALAERLRVSRESVGLSQQTVAKNTGISRSAISDIERGVRRVDSIELKKLAVVYGQTLEYLLGEDAPPSENDSTLKLLTRAHAGLTSGDREKLLTFAHFLKYSSDAPATSAGEEPPDGERSS